VFVKLELLDPSGVVASENLYWLGRDSSSYRHLNRMATATLSLTASSTRAGDNFHLHVRIRNTGTVVSLANKLTLVNAADGSRILPVYYSDNYVSLLPGESREIEIEYPAKSAKGAAQIAVRGWNVVKQSIAVASGANAK
jgi:hypothetical protein